LAGGIVNSRRRFLSLLLPAALLVASARPALAYLDAAAAYALGVKYEHGEGRDQSYLTALILYCRADSDGSPAAAFALGLMYASGHGVKRDDAIAAAWFRRAAARGYGEAAKLLRFYRGAKRVQPVCPYGSAFGPRMLVRAPAEVKALVERLAPQYKLDPKLVLAVIAVESSFQADAVSSANAQGLMQLIPATAARFGVANAFDPAENVRGGMAYLRWLLKEFKGSVSLATAAYNAGEKAVQRYHGVPPFDETRRYVRKIRAIYPKSDHPF
jgi:soluble lytic murein transglycosylase-like protein